MSIRLEISTVDAEVPLDHDYSDIDAIDRVPSADLLSYDAFFHRYMLRNRPVLVAGIPAAWDCYQNWSSSDDGHLNIDYLTEKIAQRLNTDVPVADCGRAQYNAHEKIEMKLPEYLQYWQQRLAAPTTEGQPPTDDRLLYLKDWHLRQALPSYRFYRTPSLFASDWLNESLVVDNADDYRFVYIGPAGTWTPFHADVFGSFSWSTNVAGRKRWLLLPPGEELKLADRFGQLPFAIDERQLIAAGNVRHFVIEQCAGETLFVPSGWWHQVCNTTAAISVNHNWFNGCNVWHIWRTLRHEFGRVRREIDDCRDMEDFDGHCQVMLRASHGMDMAGLLRMLRGVAERRVEVLTSSTSVDDEPDVAMFDGYRFGRAHCEFDLRAIRRVVSDMLVEVGDIYEELRKDCLRLLAIVNEVIKDS